MAVIKLTECTYDNSGNITIGDKILFQTDQMTTAKLLDQIGDYTRPTELEFPITSVRYIEAMANGFYCTESVEEIEELIKNANN